jgi:Phosphodiester glycosidase
VHSQRRGARAGLGLVTMLAVAVPAFLGYGPASPAWAADLSVPAGFHVEQRTGVDTGVDHLRLVRAEPPLVVNVARITAGAPVSLRAVLSNEEIAGNGPRLERTSSMCARVHCLLAVNGDFTAAESGEPLGGLVTGGQLLRTPSPSHHQLSVTEDGHLEAGTFEWHGKLVPTDLAELNLDGVNGPAPDDGLVLYTPAFGASTKTDAAGATLVLRVVEPAGPLRAGQTTLVEMTGLHDGEADVAIPADGTVLYGRGKGADALRSLWGRVQSRTASTRGFLRLDVSGGIAESLGGTPILLRDGARWFADSADDFTRGRHPRTMVGWNPAGDVVLATIDGREPGVSVGATLAEAADLLLALGATDGINLDGGGSTTFVAGGTVANEPSDVAVRRDSEDIIQHSAGSGDRVIGHVERPVVSALTVVPRNEILAPPAPLLAGRGATGSQALALPVPASTDPGSVPGGPGPALVVAPVVNFAREVRVAAVTADTIVAVALLVLALRRRQATAAAAGGDERHRPPLAV